ncbi:hypothetical protein QQ73_16510 [Candidatus Endoriftia persephone str. Guaymas]|nr:hypothetical protein [Candidatus Endoriftia persephone str. Guaymas]
MATQYQHRQFFRRVPNALLTRHFETMDAALDVDFGKLTETGVESIFEAFTAPPKNNRLSWRWISRHQRAGQRWEY